MNSTLIFTPGEQSRSLMEAYAENLCENLFINDTYYGNLLMCLSDLNEVLAEMGIVSEVSLNYQTDFSVLSIEAKLNDIECDMRLKTTKGQDGNSLRLELIKTLSDKLIIHANGISMEFNIGALHKSIYEERLKHLRVYLDKLIKVKKIDD